MIKFKSGLKMGLGLTNIEVGFGFEYFSKMGLGLNFSNPVSNPEFKPMGLHISAPNAQKLQQVKNAFYPGMMLSLDAKHVVQP